MEALILRFIPILDQYPFLLAAVSVITFIFFGGFIFSGIFNFIFGYSFERKR